MALKPVNWEPFKQEFQDLFARTEGGGCEARGIGEGWTQILWDLCRGLNVLSRQRVAEGLPPHRIGLIKEKDGILRVHLRDGCIGEAAALIEAAEALSETTCEACGQPGRLCDHLQWVRTLCPTHELETAPVDEGRIQ